MPSSDEITPEDWRLIDMGLSLLEAQHKKGMFPETRERIERLRERAFARWAGKVVVVDG